MVVKRLLLIVLLVIAALLGALAWLRTKEAHTFSRPYRVHTFTGTNYVLQLTSTTVGRVHTNYVVILAARLENPNPFEVLLQRDWFVLTDHDRDYYLPSTNGTQTALIRLPPHGVLERELFSYTVPGDTFAGTLAFLAGHQYFVLIKSRHPYRPEMGDGRFVTFHRRDW
jgi:hypothetical protein